MVLHTTLYTPERKRRILECSALILKSHRKQDGEVLARIRELLAELGMKEEHVVAEAAKMVVI
jgi:hypothetical protein